MNGNDQYGGGRRFTCLISNGYEFECSDLERISDVIENTVLLCHLDCSYLIIFGEIPESFIRNIIDDREYSVVVAVGYRNLPVDLDESILAKHFPDLFGK